MVLCCSSKKSKFYQLVFKISCNLPSKFEKKALKMYLFLEEAFSVISLIKRLRIRPQTAQIPAFLSPCYKSWFSLYHQEVNAFTSRWYSENHFLLVAIWRIFIKFVSIYLRVMSKQYGKQNWRQKNSSNCMRSILRLWITQYSSPCGLLMKILRMDVFFKISKFKKNMYKTGP